MLTKTGKKLVKKASLASGLAIGGGVGGIIGGIRANNLSDEDRKALAKYYGLEPDASLGWRNAARGAIGELIGELPGDIIDIAGRRSGKLGLSCLGGLLAFGGGMYGAKRATDKYSVGNADNIRK